MHNEAFFLGMARACGIETVESTVITSVAPSAEAVSTTPTYAATARARCEKVMNICLPWW